MENSNDELDIFFKKMKEIQVPESQSKEVLKNKISAMIDEKEKQRKHVPISYIIGIAASMIVITTFSVLYYPSSVQLNYSAEKGETIRHSLPDGSIVTLNAESSITYSENWDREISLSGEAFFEVKPGETFVVKTNQGNVSVLGTSFNVYTRKNEFEVACKTGKVKVSIPQKEFEQQIQSGETILFKNQVIRQLQKRNDLIGKWRNGEFYFKKQSLKNVFQELERQFNITISFESLPDKTFTGYFAKDDVQTALNMICLPLGLTHTKTGDSKFRIDSK